MYIHVRPSNCSLPNPETWIQIIKVRPRARVRNTNLVRFILFHVSVFDLKSLIINELHSWNIVCGCFSSNFNVSVVFLRACFEIASSMFWFFFEHVFTFLPRCFNIVPKNQKNETLKHKMKHKWNINETLKRNVSAGEIPKNQHFMHKNETLKRFQPIFLRYR